MQKNLIAVAALNSVFQQWKISAAQQEWNTSGDPCSGTAIDSTNFDTTTYNPFIKCDCSYNNNSTCHITHLKVYSLNVVGIIPDELWNLTFIENIDLRQNYLTGSLSASIGNLTRMQYMALGINALSGELPKELGQLTNLISLSFGSNNFSGSLPSELGNLLKLEQLYFDSSGVSGEIPSTFANLQSLVTVWGSDNELTGRIPDFIGNWSKLADLRFQGNSFEGPIPSTFSNLTSLTELRISDISNGSSSLAFIKDMKSLNSLVLRNNNISDSIPSNIGEYQSLSQLDLSFNNLTGQIPDSLFNLSSLSYLFIGNNKLIGTLPSQKSASLLNIDLSYNGLSGSFPSWVGQQNLQLNLVANNFTIDNSNSSVLPGLSCLQRNFPCNRGSGLSMSITSHIKQSEKKKEKMKRSYLMWKTPKIMGKNHGGDGGFHYEQEEYKGTLKDGHGEAWNLHENSREIELVDPKLSVFSEEEVKRMIGVALLCTQTSPTLRPPMSRVVAMLSGDIEVCSVTSKPGYLTDWKFNDVTSFMSDTSTKRTENSHSNSSESTSFVVDAKGSPRNATKPMVHEIIGEGR
ncbi:hypothetical protein L1049_022289 [Liquidambar formosana]|uniref:Uncharacterized protein n=1 Tax=Liquidambar formosana TaxID=63359 RepID=A0AAP0RCB8_LIQFO